jgi:hypothetical protein
VSQTVVIGSNGARETLQSTGPTAVLTLLDQLGKEGAARCSAEGFVPTCDAQFPERCIGQGGDANSAEHGSERSRWPGATG